MPMTNKEAIKRIKDFALYHAIRDLPNSAYTVEAFEMAIKSLEQHEIIRCKDCKHYNAGFECLIDGYGIERDNDWYCADAERRTDEAD